jgi:hypothetical protein
MNFCFVNWMSTFHHYKMWPLLLITIPPFLITTSRASLPFPDHYSPFTHRDPSLLLPIHPLSFIIIPLSLIPLPLLSPGLTPGQVYEVLVEARTFGYPQHKPNWTRVKMSLQEPRALHLTVSADDPKVMLVGSLGL